MEEKGRRRTGRLLKEVKLLIKCLCAMWENANCLQVSELKDLDDYQKTVLRKSTVQLSNELLNKALSYKSILLVPNAIIYHQGFPFPRLESRNQKNKVKPTKSPPKTQTHHS